MNTSIDINSVILHTQRLILRPWKETDLDDFYAYASVDGVGQMAGWTPHKSKEESAQILNCFISQKKIFALEYEGKVIGSIGIEEYDEKNYPELEYLYGRELGYALSKNYWERGLMTEAVQAVIRYLFDIVNLDFILAGHFDWNKQSARVIEKCGFKYIKSCPYKTCYGTVETSIENILYNTNRNTNIVRRKEK